MIYELRQYVIKDGRMQDCHRLFRDVIVPLFHEVGIRTLGFWEPIEPDGKTFVYLLGFESAQARDAIWPKFIAHEAWIAEKATWTDGAPYETTSATVLAPTDYSPQMRGTLSEQSDTG